MYLSPNSSQTTKNLGNSKTNEIIFSHISLFKHNSDVLMRAKQSTNLGFPTVCTIKWVTNSYAHSFTNVAYHQFELSYKFILKRRFRATMEWGETHFEAVFLFLDLCFYKLPTNFRENKDAQMFFPLDT